MKRGYIYAMINPNYNGKVKIGKTIREPEQIIKEMSTPEFPTDFILAYEIFVSDCDEAEKKMHEYFKKYRINSKLHFFNIPLKSVISYMNELKEEYECYDDENETTDFQMQIINTELLENEEGVVIFGECQGQISVGESIYSDATGYSYEIEGILQEFNDDFEHINRIMFDGEYFIIVSNKMQNISREFGDGDFLFKVVEENENVECKNKLLTTFDIAENYYYGINGEIQDKEVALKYYKLAINEGDDRGYFQIGNIYSLKNEQLAFDYYLKGTKKGVANCYSGLANIYSSRNDKENYKKCWNKYLENLQLKRIGHFQDYDIMLNYFEFCIKNGVSIKNKSIFTELKENIINFILGGIEFFTDEYLIKKYNTLLKYVIEELGMTLDKKNKILMIEIMEKSDEISKLLKNEKEPDILKILNKKENEIASSDKNGFQPDGINYRTKTLYSEKGFDVKGWNKDTNSKYDRMGYDIEGYDRSGFNERRFNRQGINKITQCEFDQEGFDVYGVHKSRRR